MLLRLLEKDLKYTVCFYLRHFYVCFLVLRKYSTIHKIMNIKLIIYANFEILYMHIKFNINDVLYDVFNN